MKNAKRVKVLFAYSFVGLVFADVLIIASTFEGLSASKFLFWMMG